MKSISPKQKKIAALAGNKNKIAKPTNQKAGKK